MTRREERERENRMLLYEYIYCNFKQPRKKIPKSSKKRGISQGYKKTLVLRTRRKLSQLFRRDVWRFNLFLFLIFIFL